MATITRKSEMVNLKLSGEDCQESFDLEKYQALAYGSQPFGTLMLQKVEANWNDWLGIIAQAPWLCHWLRSECIQKKQPATTPKGNPVSSSSTTAFCRSKTVSIGHVALLIYTNAVWGFGIEDWLHFPWGKEGKRGAEYNEIVSSILTAQGLKALPINRKILWDEKLYRGCGLMMPPEYGDLDRWLEKLWNETCEEVAQETRECARTTSK